MQPSPPKTARSTLEEEHRRLFPEVDEAIRARDAEAKRQAAEQQRERAVAAVAAARRAPNLAPGPPEDAGSLPALPEAPALTIAEEYKRSCSQWGVRPNTTLVRFLEAENGGGTSVLDFSCNFIGQKGVLALCSTVARLGALHTLNLSRNGLRNECLPELLHSVPHVTVLDLSGNEYLTDARRLLTFARRKRTRVRRMPLSGTSLHQRQIDQIEMVLCVKRGEQPEGDVPTLIDDTPASVAAGAAIVKAEEGVPEETEAEVLPPLEKVAAKDRGPSECPTDPIPDLVPPAAVHPLAPVDLVSPQTRERTGFPSPEPTRAQERSAAAARPKVETALSQSHGPRSPAAFSAASDLPRVVSEPAASQLNSPAEGALTAAWAEDVLVLPPEAQVCKHLYQACKSTTRSDLAFSLAELLGRKGSELVGLAHVPAHQVSSLFVRLSADNPDGTPSQHVTWQEFMLLCTVPKVTVSRSSISALLEVHRKLTSPTDSPPGIGPLRAWIQDALAHHEEIPRGLAVLLTHTRQKPVGQDEFLHAVYAAAHGAHHKSSYGPSGLSPERGVSPGATISFLGRQCTLQSNESGVGVAQWIPAEELDARIKVLRRTFQSHSKNMDGEAACVRLVYEGLRDLLTFQAGAETEPTEEEIDRCVQRAEEPTIFCEWEAFFIACMTPLHEDVMVDECVLEAFKSAAKELTEGDSLPAALLPAFAQKVSEAVGVSAPPSVRRLEDALRRVYAYSASRGVSIPGGRIPYDHLCLCVMDCFDGDTDWDDSHGVPVVPAVASSHSPSQGHSPAHRRDSPGRASVGSGPRGRVSPGVSPHTTDLPGHSTLSNVPRIFSELGGVSVSPPPPLDDRVPFDLIRSEVFDPCCADGSNTASKRDLRAKLTDVLDAHPAELALLPHLDNPVLLERLTETDEDAVTWLEFAVLCAVPRVQVLKSGVVSLARLHSEISSGWKHELSAVTETVSAATGVAPATDAVALLVDKVKQGASVETFLAASFSFARAAALCKHFGDTCDLSGSGPSLLGRRTSVQQSYSVDEDTDMPQWVGGAPLLACIEALRCIHQARAVSLTTEAACQALVYEGLSAIMPIITGASTAPSEEEMDRCYHRVEHPLLLREWEAFVCCCLTPLDEDLMIDGDTVAALRDATELEGVYGAASIPMAVVPRLVEHVSKLLGFHKAPMPARINDCLQRVFPSKNAQPVVGDAALSYDVLCLCLIDCFDGEESWLADAASIEENDACGRTQPMG
eukprot:TRINITY_DN32479_c0_g1_i1.p1 TRINITY_DN32479_c0_g1~~TRINITY_DN32479_c0_g1_i1.p1  ORF type:complete len:1244 (+),score=395.23 TRINITY_DN32479_c0_g1_i1:73-3804(+)